MRIFLTWCFLVFCFSLPAQVVNLSFDKQRILLGEQLGVTVKAFVDKGAVLAGFPIDSLPHFEVLESSKIDTTVTGNTLQLSQSLIVTSWDSGRWNLPTNYNSWHRHKTCSNRCRVYLSVEPRTALP
jgi:hypothetical protein